MRDNYYGTVVIDPGGYRLEVYYDKDGEVTTNTR